MQKKSASGEDRTLTLMIVKPKLCHWAKGLLLYILHSTFELLILLENRLFLLLQIFFVISYFMKKIYDHEFYQRGQTNNMVAF